jgi:hypothetical protein
MVIRRIAILCSVLAAAALAGTGAIAAKPGSSPPPAGITLNEADPHLGGYVTFTSTYPKTVKNPRIAVRCYQNGAMGYAEAAPYDQAFLLGGAWSDWKVAGGAADCTAELFYIVWNGNNPQQYYTLAWTSFHAAG